MCECDKRARKVREEISIKPNNTNAKFHGSNSLARNRVLQSKSINEMLRILDAREK